MQTIASTAPQINSGIAATVFAFCNAADPPDYHSREWWVRQSLIDGTDWQSIGEAALAALGVAGIIEPAPTPEDPAWEPWREAAREYHGERSKR